MSIRTRDGSLYAHVYTLHGGRLVTYTREQHKEMFNVWIAELGSGNRQSPLQLIICGLFLLVLPVLFLAAASNCCLMHFGKVAKVVLCRSSDLVGGAIDLFKLTD